LRNRTPAIAWVGYPSNSGSRAAGPAITSRPGSSCRPVSASVAPWERNQLVHASKPRPRPLPDSNGYPIRVEGAATDRTAGRHGSTRSASSALATAHTARGRRRMRCGEGSWPSGGEIIAETGERWWPLTAGGDLSGGADGPVAMDLQQVVRGCD
jgi:hypothetical protein